MQHRLSWRRLAIAAALTALLHVLAVAGVHSTTGPAWTNLLLEPFSMLMAPGLLVAVVIAGAHDFSRVIAVEASCVFYLLLFYRFLPGWSQLPHSAPPGSR